MQIPISSVKFDSETENAVLSVLRSGNIVQGEKVEEFENIFSQHFDFTHSVAVNNGTSAIVAALRACGIGSGDEVITSPFTFVATINAILEVGASVRLVDIDPDTYAINPDEIKKAVRNNTKAVLPVHLFGHCAQIEEIGRMCVDHGLYLIEDCAQAHGAKYYGEYAGSFGVGCFSFYATKNLAIGEGGMVTTFDDQINENLRLIRNHGMKERYQYEVPGSNYRMTDVFAAIGINQMSKIDDIIKKRRSNAAFLSSNLSDIEEISLPVERDNFYHSFHQYTIRVNGNYRFNREYLRGFLNSCGVSTGIYYPRQIQDYECFAQDPRVSSDETPNAKSAAAEVLSIPVHQDLSEQDLWTIVRSVRAAFNR